MFTKAVILPWMFSLSLEFNNTGLTYNKLSFGTATYKIEEPKYAEAKINPIMGGGANAFEIAIDKFNVSLSSPFDYTPKNEPEFKGDV